MTSLTVANRETAFLLRGPMGGGEQRLSVTGEGWMVEKKWVKRGRRAQRARADGRAMRRRSIAPADVAQSFHGFSRGDASRTRALEGRRSTEGAA